MQNIIDFYIDFFLKSRKGFYCLFILNMIFSYKSTEKKKSIAITNCIIYCIPAPVVVVVVVVVVAQCPHDCLLL